MEVSFVNDEFSSNIDEVIAFARKNGLKYVELRKINDKNIVDISLKEASELSVKLSSSGILVSAIASPFLKWSLNKNDFSIMGENVASEEEYFTKLMDLADIFGAPNIRMYSYLKEEILKIEKKDEEFNAVFESKLTIAFYIQFEYNIVWVCKGDGYAYKP